MFRKFFHEEKDFFIESNFSFRIFTSQLGKKSSLDPIEKSLQDIRHIDTEFCQGNTMRWAIAWTFDETFHFPQQCQSRKALKVFENLRLKFFLLIFISSLESKEKRTRSNTDQYSIRTEIFLSFYQRIFGKEIIH